MNDSFLEDLELVPVESKANSKSKPKFNEKYITTRHSSTPTSIFNHRENINQQPSQKSPAYITKSTTPSRKTSDEITALADVLPKHPSNDKNPVNVKKKTRDSKHLTPKSRSPNQKMKGRDDKLKQVENVDHLKSISPRERINYPSNSRENTQLSDGSSKENNRPTDSSGEIVDGIKTWRRIDSDSWRKKLESNPESESAMMLNAIKEIVSTYTKMESTKIMKLIQDLHINSQVNLIKQLCMMADDVPDRSSNKETSRINNLVQENHRLMETVAHLKSRVQELQKIIDNTHQENISLKLRVQELEK